MIADFHFLRPWWLVALFAPALIVWLSSRSSDLRSRWKGLISPHLLDHLIVGASRGGPFRPAWLLAGVLALAVTGAAGPAWQREAPPFVEDTAPLIVAVDLSATMDAVDVSPSRIERAKLKIRDILAARQGAKTGVVAYAGSAHLVVPPTEDSTLIQTYTDALSTRLMPKPGKDTAAALSLADGLLSSEGTAGTILLITDGIEPAEADERIALRSALVVLGVGTAEGGPVKTPGGDFLTDDGGRVTARLDLEALKTFAGDNGADVATMTDDGADVRWVVQRVRTDFAQRSAAEGDRWRDEGWWFVVPSVLLFALSFRKGWVVRMSGFAVVLKLLLPSGAEAADLTDMWLTPDQQGRLAFERGDFEGAGALFGDPMWKGAALYRAGRYQEAFESFARVDTAESWFDQGNALLRLGKFEQAVDAYKNALRRRAGWPEATGNLALAERLLEQQKDKEEDQPEQPDIQPDSVQFDEKGKQGKEGRVDVGEQTSEMWMKSIVVSPADLMARKFALELQDHQP